MSETLEGEWIGLAQAKRQLAQANISTAAIIDFLQGGMILARCKRRMHEGSDREGPPTKPLIVDNEVVPDWVWQSMSRAYCYHRWDWDAGYWQGRVPHAGDSSIVRLYGIKLRRLDVDDLAPPESHDISRPLDPSLPEDEQREPNDVSEPVLKAWVQEGICLRGRTQRELCREREGAFPNNKAPSKGRVEKLYKNLHHEFTGEYPEVGKVHPLLKQVRGE